MTVEINPGWVSAACAVVAVFGGAIIKGFCKQVDSLRSTQKILFEKHDSTVKELHEYKLHAAETFVNRVVLNEVLLPIYRSLERIEKDIQGLRGQKSNG